MFSSTANVLDATELTDHTLTWNFNSGSETFDYLATGESLTLTYTIEVEDSQGATDTQNVVITVNGSNDDPTITATPDNGVALLEEKVTAGSIVGNLHIIDTPQLSPGSPDEGGTGPDWTFDENDGFYAGGNYEADHAFGGWETDGTDYSDSAYLRFNTGVNTYTFDVADGTVINAVYTTWATRGHLGNSGATYSYDEGVGATGSVTEWHSLAPDADMVVQWVDSTNTVHSVNFDQIFATPIVVSGGNGFTISVERIGNTHQTDAIIIDYSSHNPVATLTETNANLTTSGSALVSDQDTDIVTTSVSGVVASGDTTGLDSNNAALLSMLSLDKSTVLDGSEQQDILQWDFDSSTETFDYLATGESLTLTYTIEVEDSQGATDTQSVVITINGTTDAPVITGGPDSVGLTETDSGLTSSGTFTVTDLDRSDSVTAAVDSVVVTGTGSSSVPGTLNNSTIASFLTVTPTAILDNTETSATLTWDFDSGSEAFDFLGDGENLVLTYTVSATDDDGTPLSDTETVTVTITGTNDTPDVFVDTGDNAAETLAETNATLSTSGTLSVDDLDLTDLVTSSVTGVVASGTTTGLGSNNAALLAMFSSTANVLDATELTNTLTWNFNSGSETFDYLATGESLTLTYTIEVEDSQGATDTQNVVITVNGSNDDPTITATPNNGVALLEEKVTAGSIVGNLHIIDTPQLSPGSPDEGGTGPDWTFDENDGFYAGGNYVADHAFGGWETDGTDYSDSAYLRFNTGVNTYTFDVADGTVINAVYTTWATRGTSGATYSYDGGGGATGSVAELHSLSPDADMVVQWVDSTNTVHSLNFDQIFATPIIVSGGNGFTISVERIGNSHQTDAIIIDYSSHNPVATLTETNANLSTSGSALVSDQDTDIVTTSVSGVVASGDTTGLDSNNAALLSMLSLDKSTVLDGSEQQDILQWDFDSSTETFDYLATGESLTLTYTIEVEDSQGATDTQSVVITINGTTDAPVITGGPDSVGLTETDSGLTSSGTFTVTDLDRSDSVTAAVDSVVVTGTGSSSVPGTLNNSTIASFLTVTPTAILDNTETSATLTWDFDSGSEAFDFLGDGETLVLTYTVSATDDDGTPLSDTETVTVTITGTNDTPDVFVDTGDSAAETLAETNATLSTSGTLSVGDLDLTDTVTSSVTSVVASGTTSGLGSNNAALLAMFSSTANVLDATELTDQLTWNFNSGSETFDYLATGESLTLTYTIEVDDSQGATDTQNVVITINGTADAPVITGGPDSVGMGANGSGLTSSGTLTVTDMDQSDSVTVAVDSVAVSGTGSSSVPGSLTNATLEGYLTVTPTAILDNTETSATLTWDFDSGSEAFDFLAAGETLVLTYTVSATDDDGTPQSDTETVTITITGANSGPNVFVDTGDSVAESLNETNSTLTTSGTLTVEDSNLTDVVTSSVTGVVASGMTTGLGSNNAALLAMLTSTANVLDATELTDDLTWNFNSGSETFDYLATGESLTLTYTIEVEDSQGATDTQDVAITINGTNDGPETSAIESSVLSYMENDGLLVVSSTISISDVDNDIESAVVAISSSYVNGEDVLSFSNQNGITGTWNALTGELTLTGTATPAQYESALRSVAYENVSDRPSEATRTVSFTVNDGDLDSMTLTRNISVTAVNDDPVNIGGLLPASVTFDRRCCG